MRNVQHVLNRIFAATGIRNQKELASYLGITSPAISDWKNKGSIPRGSLYHICRNYGLNPDWVLTGEGSERLSPEEASRLRQTDDPFDFKASLKEIKPVDLCDLSAATLEQTLRRSLQSVTGREYEVTIKHLNFKDKNICRINIDLHLNGEGPPRKT